jgi:hypothetical protein
MVEGLRPDPSQPHIARRAFSGARGDQAPISAAARPDDAAHRRAPVGPAFPCSAAVVLRRRTALRTMSAMVINRRP